MLHEVEEYIVNCVLQIGLRNAQGVAVSQQVVQVICIESAKHVVFALHGDGILI